MTPGVPATPLVDPRAPTAHSRGASSGGDCGGAPSFWPGRPDTSSGSSQRREAPLLTRRLASRDPGSNVLATGWKAQAHFDARLTPVSMVTSLGREGWGAFRGRP